MKASGTLIFNRFRSTSEVVKQHQSPFIKYFEGCRSVLSLGCGRGEFIEALVERGIGAFGIDVDAKNMAAAFNRNVDMLNDAIFGPENYAAIGKK